MKFLLALFVVLASGVHHLAAVEKQKVIIDCDLAGDVDDAFAMALALASPELDILGFVMDHGDTSGRARVACRLLYETGREDIPVVVGRATPGVVGRDTELAGPSHQFAWAANFDRVKPIKQNAAEFIVEKLNQFPGEITLITLGPVPNISDALDKDPECLKRAKGVVSMFGSFYMGYNSTPVPSAEWNVFADVPSAKRFASSGASITYAGLDVTTFVKLKEEQRARLGLRNSPLTDALCALYTLWRYEEYSAPDPTLFDAVAVGMVLWPDLFQTRSAHVRVIDGGYTVIDESQPPNSTVALSIKMDAFIDRIMERYLQQNMSRP